MKNLTAALMIGLTATALAPAAIAQVPVLAYSTKGDFAYLDFNPPGGKTPAVKFACAKGSAEMDIADYEGATGAELRLASGPETLPLEAQKATGARGDFLKAHTEVGAKVFVQFRENGRLDITGQGFNSKITADAASKRDVEQFFIACEPFEG